jgi:hypothetical protein
VSITEVWQIIESNLEPLRQAINDILPPLAELEKEIAGDEETDESSKRNPNIK